MKHCSSCGPIRSCSWHLLGVCSLLVACTAEGDLPPGFDASNSQASLEGSGARVPAGLSGIAPNSGLVPPPSGSSTTSEGTPLSGDIGNVGPGSADGSAGSVSIDSARASGAAEARGASNRPPTVAEARFSAFAGNTLSVDAARGLLRFASDADGDSLLVSSIGVSAAVPYGGGSVSVFTALGGSLTAGADGSFSYAPPAGIAAQLDRVPFSIADGRGGSTTAELVLGISPGTLEQPGFEIAGGSNEQLVGSSVSGVGDFNGDGLDDVLVTARGDDRDVAHLLFGSRAPGNVSLADGVSVRIIAETPGLAAQGVAISPAGHVNDDRLADLIIGVHQEPVGSDPVSALAGKAYVIFGSEAPPAEINLATLEQEQRGFVILGATAQEHLGFSVAGAGDVNGSGGDDLLLGAIGAASAAGEPAGDGRAYVVFGKSTFTPVDLANLAGGGYRLDGEADEAGQAGVAVTGLGDWNGDGRADIAVSAPQLNAGAGRIYVAFGRAFGGVVELGDVAFGVGGFAIDGPGDLLQAGRSLQSGGNLGGSELPDLIIGNPNPAGLDSAGQTVVVYGKRDTEPVQLDQIDGGNALGFVVHAEAVADRSGLAVAAPGDFNGDGASDLLIGASEQGTDQVGAAYLLFGSSALQAGVDLLGLPSERGITLRGQPPAGGRLGFSAAAAGDVNGDGYPDVILGAPQHDGAAGRAYVLLGHPSAPALVL